MDARFQPLTEEEENWLDIWYHEGAKELTVEALQVCIDLVSPASSMSNADLGEFLRLWGGMCYGGTTFKTTMNANVRTALEIHEQSKARSDRDLRPVADAFRTAAQTQYDKLTANGMPDGLRPWRRVPD